MNQPIEDEAKRIAREKADKYIRSLELDNFNTGTYLKVLSEYLKLPSHLQYSSENARVLAKKYEKEVQESSYDSHIKILKDRHRKARSSLEKITYPEHSEDIFKKHKDMYSGSTSDAIYFIGSEKPKRLTWKSIIRDKHPKSDLRFKIGELLDSEPLFEYFNEDENKMIMNLKQKYIDKELKTRVYDQPNDRLWNIVITIREYIKWTIQKHI